MPSVSAMRYAHSDGLTDVCYDDNGRYILTCGSDGDVRIWDGVDDDDAISHRCGDKALSVAFKVLLLTADMQSEELQTALESLTLKGNRYFATTDTNTVQAYTFPDGTPDGILTRFTAPANHIVLNESGSSLVAGSSDFTVKLVDTSSCSHKTFQGHEAPVLSVAIDPKEEYLASSSCDGSVKVWKISDRSVGQSWNVLPKCSDVSLSKTVCRICWHPQDGKVLYVPIGKEIHVYERESWNKTESLSAETELISVLSISKDGKYLAAGCSDGWIFCFDLHTKKCIDKHRNEKGLSISSLMWNPKCNMEVVFCDNQGQLGLLSDIGQKPSETPDDDPNQVPSGVFDDNDDDFLLDADGDDDKQSDKYEVDDGVKIARPILSDDDDADSIPDMTKAPSDVDDDASSVASDKIVKPEVRLVEGFKPTPMQRAFQPSSTPAHLSSRFMVWNGVGIVRQYNSEEENSIDIEFHDTSVHHAMHITNNHNYTLASLSTEAVLLASEGDSESGSKLTCMHFSSWDNNKEWSTSMPEREDIEAVALGEGWAAVATDLRNVRLFTVAGVQKEIFSVPGPVVCMVGSTNQLLIIYHRAMAIPGDQCLGITLLNVADWRRELNEDPLPLSAKSTLTWAGFSAEGTPFYMDSEGIIRMLNRGAAKSWAQVANTRDHAKGKSDHYWIVGIHENPQQIRCIPCKGSRYPPVLPRPAVTVLPFKLAMCEPQTEKSQYEELLWRTRAFSQHFDQWTRQGYEFDETLKTEALKPAQEALMKLFALSARSEREFRALEVCEMMSDEHTLQLAIKYSSRMRFIQLAQRISEMAVRKAEEREEKATESDLYEEDMSVRRPSGLFSRQDIQTDEQEVEVEQTIANDVEMVDGEEESSGSGPTLHIKPKEMKNEKPINLFKARSNPFKVSTPHPVQGYTKGTQVFDSISKRKEKSTPPINIDSSSKERASIKKVSQPKLFMKKKVETKGNQNQSDTPQKAVSAFELWREANNDKLIEEQPEMSEEDLTNYATEQFRQLPRDERQEWLKKAKSLNEKSKENTSTTGVTDGGDRKRKREEEEGERVKKQKDSPSVDVKKTPLSQTTNSKLANFAFSKEGE